MEMFHEESQKKEPNGQVRQRVNEEPEFCSTLEQSSLKRKISGAENGHDAASTSARRMKREGYTRLTDNYQSNSSVDFLEHGRQVGADNAPPQNVRETEYHTHHRVENKQPTDSEIFDRSYALADVKVVPRIRAVLRDTYNWEDSIFDRAVMISRPTITIMFQHTHVVLSSPFRHRVAQVWMILQPYLKVQTGDVDDSSNHVIKELQQSKIDTLAQLQSGYHHATRYFKLKRFPLLQACRSRGISIPVDGLALERIGKVELMRLLYQ